MEYQIIWFILWGVLWAVYFMLDGFVLGTGMLYHYLAPTDQGKKILIRTIGPVWDGNEVWLVTAGGATFAAFPTTYALMFSYLYSALLLLLFSLIIRGVSLEFRGKISSAGWNKLWDTAIFLGSALPALLLGVAFGNIFRGLPMDAAGYHGSFLSLLNPYGILTGVLFVFLFLVHGSLYASIKTDGELSDKATLAAKRLWIGLLIIAVSFLIATAFYTKLYDNYLKTLVLLVVPALTVTALIGIRIFLSKNKPFMAFSSSCMTIVLVVCTGITGLFPNLIPSNMDSAYSLTIFNSSSSIYTLKIMTVVAVIFVPIVIAYKAWVYRVFRSRITKDDVLKDDQAY
ncbi:MAG TPA: cytochrome d ubiquinol oxidase subunit II [Nitrospirota bacterium]|nr:cytochrome d ubiquinol oxidase subunit II [Nitrospirota bacterium]